MCFRQINFIFIALLCNAAWKFLTDSDILAAVTQRRRGYATIPTWDQQKRVRSLDLKAGKTGFPGLNRKMWPAGRACAGKTEAPAALTREQTLKPLLSGWLPREQQ